MIPQWLYEAKILEKIIVKDLVDIVLDNTVMQDGSYIVEYSTARAVRKRVKLLGELDKKWFKKLIMQEFRGQYPAILR